MEHTGSGIQVRHMTLVALFAAFLAVISQIQLPMPTGVPVTIQVFAVALAGVVLGWKLGLASVLVFLLCGAVGAPVFAGFQGGLQVLVGVTGGYLMAWPLMAALSGIRIKHNNPKMVTLITIILALIGLAAVEGFGGFWWCRMTAGDLRTIMIYSLTAFIPKDIVITILAVVIGQRIRKVAGSYLDI